jgi:hypothetical protein
MAEWFALLYKIQPGSGDTVADLFRQSGRPQHTVTDDQGNEVGKLLRTIVFVGHEACVRVVEIEGDLRTVARHMSRQQEVRDFEDAIEQYLTEPRDMRSPEGATEFFRLAGLRCVLDRKHDE